MKDRDVDKLLENWAEHEAASAPEMRPTAEMYRLVRASARGRTLSLARARWGTLGAALAAIVVLAVVYVVAVHPSLLIEGPTVPQVAQVRQRKGFDAEKGVVARGQTLSGEKGSRGAPGPFTQLAFHFQRSDSRIVESIDLRVPQRETLSLTADDNYRLLLETDEERTVYVFQWMPSNELVQLFPSERTGAGEHPLQGDRATYIPPQPNWLYLEGEEGEVRLYVLASARPLQELEDLYLQYVRTRRRAARQKLLPRVLEGLEDVVQGGVQGAEGWVFVFEIRDG